LQALFTNIIYKIAQNAWIYQLFCILLPIKNKDTKGMHIRYLSDTTLSHLKPQQGLSERYQRRAIDVTLAAKLTLTYA
jgi:hypothetical protein